MPWPPDLKTHLGVAHNPPVVCACGRETHADMMVDVRPVAHVIGATEPYLCDSCMAHHFRHGHLTHEQFARAHGAPLDHVQRAASCDAALAEHFKR